MLTEVFPSPLRRATASSSPILSARCLTAPRVSPLHGRMHRPELVPVSSLVPRRSKLSTRGTSRTLLSASHARHHNGHAEHNGLPLLLIVPDAHPRRPHQAHGHAEFPGFELWATSTSSAANRTFSESVTFWQAQVEAAAGAAAREQPVYLGGEGSGALVALVVAATCGLDINRVVLINPPTAWKSSMLRNILTVPSPPLPFPPTFFPWQLNPFSPPKEHKPVSAPVQASPDLGTQTTAKSVTQIAPQRFTSGASQGLIRTTAQIAPVSAPQSTAQNTAESTAAPRTAAPSSSGAVIQGATQDVPTTRGDPTPITPVSTVPWLPLPVPPLLAAAAARLPTLGLQAAAEKLQTLLSASQEERRSYVQLLDQGVAAAEKVLGRVSQRTMVLAGGQDVLLDSAKESERLVGLLPRCQACVLPQQGLSMLHSPGFDLQAELEAVGFYTPRLRFTSAGPPVPFGRPGAVELPSHWDVAWANAKRGGLDSMVERLCSPVFISTLEGGERVEGLGGLPPKGPMVVVGNHQLMAPDTPQLIQQVLTEKGLLLRGLGHPALFLTPQEADEQLGLLAQLQGPTAELFKTFGAVPVAAKSLHKLLATGEAVLLYPGGEREIYKRRNEKYQLFWPSRAEFVRTAAKFGSTIVPLAAVGVEECVDVLVDSKQLLDLPLVGAALQGVLSAAPKARAGATDVQGYEQLFVPPLVSVSVPSRLYFLFQKPIHLQPDMCRDKVYCQEIYEQVKQSVESGIEWLLQKRKGDPYADFLPRMMHENTVLGGSRRRAPTFKL